MKDRNGKRIKVGHKCRVHCEHKSDIGSWSVGDIAEIIKAPHHKSFVHGVVRNGELEVETTFTSSELEVIGSIR